MSRVLFILGALLLALLVFWFEIGDGAGPARGQARPSWGSVSPIIYPVRTPTIRAAHGNPAHSRLRCVRCHEGAAQATSSGQVGLPEERTCLPCHAEAVDRQGGAGECATCHLNWEEGVFQPDSPTFGRIRFSHQLHARRGVGCLSCHEDVSTSTGSRHLPTMESCIGCHESTTPQVASGVAGPRECTMCHLQLPDGRMRSRYPEGWLNPPIWLGGLHHDRDFLTRHRWVASDSSAECATCHTENQCVACHDGRVPLQRVHAGNFIAIHSDAARRNDSRCTSCHTTQLFCTECHSRLGLSTMSAPIVRTSERYHPPDDVWVTGPALHGREARRNMNACVSCHAERDCVSCHGVRGVGAGISPHPPSFLSECDARLAANSRACVRCHGDLSALRALCR